MAVSSRPGRKNYYDHLLAAGIAPDHPRPPNPNLGAAIAIAIAATLLAALLGRMTWPLVHAALSPRC
jgi:hypothetical protein